MTLMASKKLTFRPGNYIWSLPLWIWTQTRHLGTFIPRFCTEFRYLLYGQSGLAWGAIFEKNTNINKVTFFKIGNVQKIHKCQFLEQKAAGGQWHPESPMNSNFFTEISKSDFSPKSVFLVTFFHILTIFYWKPKWSVRSIGTFCTAWIEGFVTQKEGLGGKVKMDIFKNGVWKMKFEVWVLKMAPRVP